MKIWWIFPWFSVNGYQRGLPSIRRNTSPFQGDGVGIRGQCDDEEARSLGPEKGTEKIDVEVMGRVKYPPKNVNRKQWKDPPF